jgi:RNA polymerase sigma-70 factor, ECF subfamily
MSLSLDSIASEKKMKPATARLTESRLIQDARHGKPEAFETLCHTLTPRLLRIAFRITRNQEDAEDAVQDSLMRAFTHLESFRENSSFSTWLTRIVMNSALMIRRKNRTAPQFSSDDVTQSGEARLPLQIPDHSPNPEESYEQRERRTILHQAIRKLRPKMRAVVEIAQLQEMPLKETARVLDISVAAAKGRFFQARVALRRSATLRAIAQARTEPAA